MIFRDLDPIQEAEFRQWAIANYTAGQEISELWHPVVRQQCQRINDVASENKAWKRFIHKHEDTIDAVIRREAPGFPIDDEERENWVRNNEALYNLALSEGLE